MSYRADKQVIDTHTQRPTDRYTDAGDDSTRRLILALGKIELRLEKWTQQGFSLPSVSVISM